MLDKIVDKLMFIAKKNPDGFTVRITDFSTIYFGYSASYDATQNSFNREDLKKVVQHALDNDKIVGGWYDEQDNLYYFDSSKIFYSESEAIEFAKANNQKAIFNLTEGITIDLR